MDANSGGRGTGMTVEICPYCTTDSDGYVLPLEKKGHAFIRFGVMGWEITMKAKGWHGSAKIRHCPMCGRKLMEGDANGED